MKDATKFPILHALHWKVTFCKALYLNQPLKTKPSIYIVPLNPAPPTPTSPNPATHPQIPLRGTSPLPPNSHPPKSHHNPQPQFQHRYPTPLHNLRSAQLAADPILAPSARLTARLTARLIGSPTGVIRGSEAGSKIPESKTSRRHDVSARAQSSCSRLRLMWTLNFAFCVLYFVHCSIFPFYLFLLFLERVANLPRPNICLQRTFVCGSASAAPFSAPKKRERKKNKGRFDS